MIKTNQTIGPRQQRKPKTETGSGLLGNDFRLGKNLLTSGTLTKGISLGSGAIDSELRKK